MVLFTFVVLFFLILRFTVTLFNFLSNPKITSFRSTFSSTVSIVICVQKEPNNLYHLLDSIKSQDYQSFQVFVFQEGMEAQDQSFIKEICEQDTRFELLDGPLTDLSMLEARVQGSYLLFLDANTQINAGLLNALIYRTKVFKLGIISVLPSQIITSFKQQILLPLSDYLILNMVPLRLIRLFKSSVLATANADCLFIDAEICFRQQWLSRVDSKKGIAELLRIAKQDRYKAETLLGNHFIDKYATSNDKLTLDVVAKNLMLFFNDNLFAGLIYVFLVVIGPIIILFGFDLKVLILPFGLIFLSRVMISFLTAQNPIYNLLTHPLQMIMLLMVYLSAITKQLLTSGKHKAG